MIEAHNLTRRFGNFVAADNISFHVPDGAILALLGPNGAGKTTTVRMLAGLIAPSEGDATVAGINIRHNPSAVRACVGLVTDSPGLYEQMNLPAYLDFFGTIYQMSPAARRQRIDELITFFDLQDHRKERMVGFSKGMKQKVALARALLHQPAALFLDEPTSGLDPLAARAVRDLIVNLKHASRSIILCTHDLDEAERIADVVAIMHHGHIVASDAPAALRASASPETLVRIDLAAPCPAASEILANMTGITLTRHISDPLTVTRLEYHTPQPQITNPTLLSRLVGAGAQLVSVTCETHTLEDVYAAAVGSPSSLSAINGHVPLPLYEHARP